MLAYVFWHRRRDGVDAAEYEARLRAFHDSPYEDFVAGLGAETVWRRQLVLGPAPELCAVTEDATGRRWV